MALSTLDAELMAIVRGVKDVLYVTTQRAEIGFPAEGPATIFTDSQVAIRFLEDSGPTPNRQTRHIRMRVRFIKDAIARNIIKLEFVPSKYNCADALTKALSFPLHRRHIINLSGQGVRGQLALLPKDFHCRPQVIFFLYNFIEFDILIFISLIELISSLFLESLVCGGES